LGGVQHADAVSDAVATALGVQGRQEVSVSERIVEYLRPLRLLLVLDNCEHVAAAAARVTEAVAGSCPGVTILTTSREPLGTDREWVLPVAPLAVPPPGEGDSATVAAAPAVRLLLERAAAAAPGFAIDDGNAPAVAAVVRRLDGLPLALELAAPRLRAMAPAELVERLDGRFGLLRARSGPERHRTLSALVDWSHELLTPPERHCFARLAVFAGPFDLAAAEAVCGEEDDDGDEFDVTTVVADLVDRSMLDADTSTRPTRYSMLETLRAFGRARLAASSAEEVARRAHATYVVAHAEVADRGLRGAEGGRLDRRAHPLHRRPPRGARMGVAGGSGLGRPARRSPGVVLEVHLPPEVPGWAEETGETVLRAGAEVPRLPAVLGVAAAGARTRGDHARAAELAERGIAAARDDDDPDLRYPLLVQSGLALFHGRLDEADGLADLAACLARSARDPAWAAHATANRSMAATYRGDTATAERLAEDAAAIAAPTGNPTAMGWASYAAAEAVTAADPDRAAALLDRARVLATGVRNRYLAGVALVSAAALHGRHGDPAVALRMSAEVIDHWHRAGNRTQQWTTIRNVVELLSRRDEDSPAAVLDAAVASRTTAAPAFGDAARRLELARARMRSRLDPATYAAATARGRSLTDDEVVALARRAVAQVAEPSPIS
jgi:predicted ATPase